MGVVYATITIEMSKAGLHCICEELEEDVFCIEDLQPLVKLINDAETYCNPDTVFRLTEKGMKEDEEKINQELEN